MKEKEAIERLAWAYYFSMDARPCDSALYCYGIVEYSVEEGRSYGKAWFLRQYPNQRAEALAVADAVGLKLG